MTGLGTVTKSQSVNLLGAHDYQFAVALIVYVRPCW